MRLAPRLSSVVAAALLCAGCPPNGPPATDGNAPVASATGAAPATSTAPEVPADPLAGMIFTRAQVLAIYTAEHVGGKAREAALREHRLIDAAGNEVPTRARAYERALQALADKDPQGWSAFIETLPERAPGD